MKNILKLIASVLIFSFSATFAFGADTIRSKITLTPVSPIFFENYVGIETPLKDQDLKLHLETSYGEEVVNDVTIKDPGGFISTSASEAELKDGVQVGDIFSLKAPGKEGVYTMIFEGKTKAGKTFDFSTDIKVVQDDPMQTWMRVGIIAGVVVVAATVIMLLANSGRR